MNYCNECGHKLKMKMLEHEGMTPYCEHCNTFRFPIFNTAVSMIVLSPDKENILLIQQYNKKNNILVAGYVNKGENMEMALARELKEEIGLGIKQSHYLKSEYFEPSNTVICNYAVVADSTSLADISTWEVDYAQWFTFEEAKHQVKPCSLAQRFLANFFQMWSYIKHDMKL